ncbi:MAG: acyl--CoA ligase [Alphaproteobacteria bacterium]|nr:acyl--CoA ligase [Alphaproteobacteria bacterium]
MNTILTLLSRDRLKACYDSGFWREDTIYRIAGKYAEATPEASAVRDQRGRLTYRQLLDVSDRFAADLHRRGVRRGQRVAVWLPSRIETAIALLACSRNGYVCCPSLHRDHTVDDVVGLLRGMGAAALIMQDGYGADADRREIGPRLDEICSLRHVYRLAPPKPGEISRPFDTLLDASADAVADPKPVSDPDSVVYLAYTSGTGGAPKGVMHSDNTVLANARAIADDWNFGSNSVIYSLSPLSHNLGFGSLIVALAVGGQLVAHDLPRGASLVDRLRKIMATFLVGVPTHAIDLLTELRDHGENPLDNLEGFRISGASAPTALIEGLMGYGIMPQSGYGMTEACSHHYTLPDDDPKRIAETSGRVCPGYEVRIWSRDNRDVEVPIGEIGEIGGRGASLMLGYFDDQRATENAFNAHGWFMTGDLGWVDADGYIRVTGRKKDVIIRGGHNIFPAHIEALAMRHDAIERAAAVPVPDARLGEKVCLAVTLRHGEDLPPAAILDHLDDAGLSKYDMPEYILPLEQIPLTASGKILKRELITWIEQGQVVPTPVRWRQRARQ